jgi:hypothetical protein
MSANFLNNIMCLIKYGFDNAFFISFKFSTSSTIAYENCVKPYSPISSIIGEVAEPLLQITLGKLKCPFLFVSDHCKLIFSHLVIV